MNVSPLRSVRAKLFFYMSVLVLLTILGITFQFGRTFIKYAKEKIQESVQTFAESSGSKVEGELEKWRAQIATTVPTLSEGEEHEFKSALRRFIDANPSFVSIHLFQAPSANSTAIKSFGEAFTSTTDDPRFEDKVPEKIYEKLQQVARGWTKREIPRFKKDREMVESVAKSTGLPLMLIATRFEVENSPRVLWAVVSAWQTEIIKNLPKSRSHDSAILDGKGRVFSSPRQDDMVARRRYASAPLVSTTLKGLAPSGFVDEYRNAAGMRRIGAFYRLPRYGLAVVIEQDVEAAYQVLWENAVSTALWATLFVLIAVMFSFIGATGITSGLREVAIATSRIAQGDFQYRILPKSKDEVGQLASAVNNMSARIVNLMASQVEKARFEKELETARMVQSTFFPKTDVSRGPLLVTGAYQPASECGGDLWGHFVIGDGVDFIFIADAMGHGAPAALVTAMAYSTTMTIADIVKDRGMADSPSAVLGRLNRIIYEAVGGTISMTFFALIVDWRTGRLTYANAGHNFPVIVPQTPGDTRAGRAAKPISKRSDLTPITLKLMGTPLGMDLASSYKEASIDLKAGDKLFLFTDGLIECTSPEGKVWGRKYMLEQVVETALQDAEKMKSEMMARAFGFFGTKPLDDDVTVVVAEISKQWKPSAAPAPAPKTAHSTAPKAELPRPPAPVHASPQGAALQGEALPSLPQQNTAASASKLHEERAEFSLDLAMASDPSFEPILKQAESAGGNPKPMQEAAKATPATTRLAEPLSQATDKPQQRPQTEPPAPAPREDKFRIKLPKSR